MSVGLIEAAIRGNLPAARSSISQARGRDSTGRTALMHAAERGHADLVRLLRPREARLQDSRGWTALFYAVDKLNANCIELLLPEQDLRNRDDETALDLAERRMKTANAFEASRLRRIIPQLSKQVVFPRLPSPLSGYKLTGQIGKGAFGIVYSAQHEVRGNCALKVVEYQGQEGEEEALAVELEVPKTLMHPNILHYYETLNEKAKGVAYIVMPWYTGTLIEEMRRYRVNKRRYTDEEVWAYIQQIAAGLAYLHSKGVVHRDLKPGNILLSDSGTCILADLGLASTVKRSLVQASAAGTVLYMAPEQHKREAYGSAVDVWALGVLVYEMCTGSLPFSNREEIISFKSPALPARCPNLTLLVQRMLMVDPVQRPTAWEISEIAAGLTGLKATRLKTGNRTKSTGVIKHAKEQASTITIKEEPIAEPRQTSTHSALRESINGTIEKFRSLAAKREEILRSQTKPVESPVVEPTIPRVLVTSRLETPKVIPKSTTIEKPTPKPEDTMPVVGMPKSTPSTPIIPRMSSPSPQVSPFSSPVPSQSQSPIPLSVPLPPSPPSMQRLDSPVACSPLQLKKRRRSLSATTIGSPGIGLLYTRVGAMDQEIAALRAELLATNALFEED
ncbi:Kinase, NEK [Giardia muris]|uniref:non-specific serine/threonine protein kinase n=1 Tax=Giardia muris TaxID=5742 RepID=A0A4Z1SZ66_GIAMU|nr:Kinase, NEK [Giardia muris]|eukprot:TNJ26943.1 Kinase, NEK [Giardia muris]